MYNVLCIADAANIILADFNLAVSTPVSTPTAKFKSPPNFPAIRLMSMQRVQGVLLFLVRFNNSARFEIYGVTRSSSI